MAEARGAAGAFISGLVGVEAIHAGFMGAIERGVGLQHLSKQTGESVGSLYKLQRGFQSAGVSADDVGGVLYRMNRALGGVNEIGEHTEDIFKRLDLNLRGLRSGGSVAAFQAILTAMARLNQTSASAAAGAIFGRGGAQSMIQLSRSSKEFAEGIKAAGAGALMFQTSAAAFERLHHTFEGITENAKLIWVGFAEGAAPAIQSILDMLNKIDFAKIGKKAGEAVGVIEQSIKDGDFATLISLSFAAGFEQATWQGNKFTVTFCAGLSAAIPEAMIAGFQAAFSVLEQMGSAFYHWQDRAQRRQAQREIDKLNKPEVARWLPEGYRKSLIAGYQKIVDEPGTGLNDMDAGVGQDRDARTKSMVENARKAVEKGAKAAGDAWNSFGPAPHEELDKLKKYWRQKKALIPPNVPDPEEKKKKHKDDLLEQIEGYRPQFTSLEKMGFAMTGIGNPGLDFQRQTATNTAIIANWAQHFDDYSRVHDPVHQPD